jgi:hypothetical protein
MTPIKTKLLLLLVFNSVIGYQNLNAQYKPPYKIVNKYGDQVPGDSIWVLYDDIRKAKHDILVPVAPLISPKILKVGDSIMLDSNYRLSLKITNIQWKKDSSSCQVSALMPERRNAVMVIKYRTFGDIWVFEGSTKATLLDCDQLNILLWDPKFIIFKTSEILNCE